MNKIEMEKIGVSINITDEISKDMHNLGNLICNKYGCYSVECNKKIYELVAGGDPILYEDVELKDDSKYNQNQLKTRTSAIWHLADWSEVRGEDGVGKCIEKIKEIINKKISNLALTAA